MNHIKLDREKKIPHVKTKLRSHHIVTMPDEIYAASGIVIMGRRIKSLIFSTDIATIRNCNADAVLAVYPFTPQQIIADAIVSTSSLPVFCGVGGGTTTGARVVMLAKDAEAFGAMAVVVNAPTTNDVIAQIADIIDIPIVVTVLDENTDIDARLEAGATIFNVSAAARTPEVVRILRERYPDLPIIATGGPSQESIRETVAAGANAISFTPPTAEELFHGLMTRYRNEHESKTKGEA
ncbi:hydrolase [Clostridium sp. MCC345]|uniref:hydrolase n=1 Tax=Clostridium sp. MCC345 TaxID=2592645 RepID=UPI001C014417|nr:hydrolase [Clostridium sp. MCC345]